MSGLSPASLSEDGDSSRRAIHKGNGNDPSKCCKVCGDKANGYNFGVLTCESCKAFFRRNAVKESEIRCPFSNSCGITPISRRYCQACRLNKCFAVGMSRDWIVEQKPKERKRVKKEEADQAEEDSNSDDEVSVSKAYLKELIRKAKRRPASCECTCKCGFYPQGTQLTALIPPTQCSTATPMIRAAPAAIPYQIPMTGPWRDSIDPSALLGFSPSFPHIPTGPSPSISALHGSAPSAFSPIPPHSNPASCEAPIASPQTPRSIRGAPQEDVSALIGGYSHLFELSRPQAPRLTSEESNLMQELVKAAEPLNKPIDMQLSPQLSLMEVVKITEKALRRIVVMARELSAFNQLSIDERKHLIKGSCCELLILRGVMAFDSHRNLWMHGTNQGVSTSIEVKLDVFKGTSEVQAYEQHKRFLESIDERVRKQEKIILVLMAILIFQPDRSTPESRPIVQKTQQKYNALLRKVLESEFGNVEASVLHERIKLNLRDLRQLNQGLIRIYYGFDTAQLDPLIKELFDMKT